LRACYTEISEELGLSGLDKRALEAVCICDYYIRYEDPESVKDSRIWMRQIASQRYNLTKSLARSTNPLAAIILKRFANYLSLMK
jgi:hypothetical protein